MTIATDLPDAKKPKMMMLATTKKTITVPVPLSKPPPCSSSFHNHEPVSNNSIRLLLQNYSSFKRSGEPSRIMYCHEDGSWNDFNDEVVSRLRFDFVNGKPVVEAYVNGFMYLFDFLRMFQVDFATFKERSIAWIDVDGKCFFPKLSVGDDFSRSLDCVNLDDVEFEVRLNGNGNGNSGSCSSGKRKREVLELNYRDAEEQSDESSSNNQNSFSKRRLTENLDVRISRWPNAKLVRDDERVNAVVRKLFLSGVKDVDHGVTITAIHQCLRMRPMESARWEVFRKQMEITKHVRGASKTIFAWYGTSAKGVENVLLHGFGIPSKPNDSESHGIGIHLSPVSLPHLSAVQSEVDDKGEKHVILCRFILGNVEKVEAGSRQSRPSNANFDTGVDDLKNPKRYVVWYANMNTHIIPECVVSFKSFDHQSGDLGESTLMKWVPNATNSCVVKLFSKLKSSLPSEKVKELQSLCSIYKAGKLAKDMFIRRLRVISGDEMLLSTIREARGST